MKGELGFWNEIVYFVGHGKRGQQQFSGGWFHIPRTDFPANYLSHASIEYNRRVYIMYHKIRHREHGNKDLTERMMYAFTQKGYIKFSYA